MEDGVPAVAPAATQGNSSSMPTVSVPSRDTSEALCQALERWLRSPAAAAQRKADGSVPAASAVCASKDVMDLSGGDPLAVVGAVLSCPGGPVTCDRQGSDVRLRGLLERVRSLAEAYVTHSQSGLVGVMDLLQEPRISKLLHVIPEPAAKLQTLRDALLDSTLLVDEGTRVTLLPELLMQRWSVAEATPESSRPIEMSVMEVASLPVLATAWPARREYQDIPVLQYTESKHVQKWSSQQAQQEERHGVRARLCADIANLLKRCPPELARNKKADGSVSVHQIWDVNPRLKARCYENSKLMLRAVATTKQFEVTMDETSETIRLMTFEEQLCAAAEWCLRNDGASGMPLVELAARPEILDILSPDAQAPTWAWEADWFGQSVRPPHSGVPDSAALTRLGEALETSEMLRLWIDAGECWVARRPFEPAVCAAVEELLKTSLKAISIQSREGEVPVAWIAEMGPVRAALQREGMHSRGEVAHEAICRAIRVASKHYELVGCSAHPSIRPCAPNGGTGEPPLLQLPDVIPSIPRARQAGPSYRVAHANFVKKSNWQEVCDCRKPSAAECLDGDAAASGDHAADAKCQTWALASTLTQPTRETAARWAKQKVQRDGIALRRLLNHYFEPFNVQHNRLLMSLVEEQCPPDVWLTGKMPSPCWCPYFRVDDLLGLPRLQKIFVSHPGFARRLKLLRAALPEVTDAEALEAGNEAGCPWVRLEVGPNSALRLEMLNPPKLRLIVEPAKALSAVQNVDLQYSQVASQSNTISKQPATARLQLRPELRALLDFEVGPHASVKRPPAEVLLVVSYSVSSDLSHSQSPKGEKTRRAVFDGVLDPVHLAWDTRLQRLKRQLLYYGADIICLQAVQSIGFDLRCSEDENSWFKCADEPQANHLVFLYRALTKENYDVVYAPTLKLPGSKAMCLGNAIFWKRSRWRLERHFTISKAAVCAQLSSRVGGPCILACSAKTAASYAVEWGETISDVDVLSPVSDIAEQLLQQASLSGAQPIFCGDFGCEPNLLRTWMSGTRFQHALPAVIDQTMLEDDSSPQFWQSAYATAFGVETWTSASEHVASKAVDYLLHTPNLELMAVLSGRPGEADVIELLSSGYPSDHLLLMAAFKVPGGDADAGVLDMSYVAVDENSQSRNEGFGVVGDASAETVFEDVKTARNSRKQCRFGSVGSGGQRGRCNGGVAAGRVEDEVAEASSSSSCVPKPQGFRPVPLSEFMRPPLRQGKGRKGGRNS